MGRRKALKDPAREKQVRTFISRYGKQGYAIAGSRGGKRSPTKFTSSNASEMAIRSWEKRRQRQADQERKNEQHETRATKES